MAVDLLAAWVDLHLYRILVRMNYEMKQRDFRCLGAIWGRFVSTDSDQTETALGPLDNLNQVGARICNGLGITRACLETQKLEQLEARMDEIADRLARNRTNAARERTSHP